MNKLKKCPFCGATPILRGEYYKIIECYKCGANQNGGADEELLIQAWNNRVGEESETEDTEETEAQP